MDNSKQAKEMMQYMSLVEEMGSKKNYSTQDIASMMKTAVKMVDGGRRGVKSWSYSQDMLNKVGSAMREFISLRKGDPALDYKEGEMQGDQHDEPYGKHSYEKADKGRASADMKGQGPGPVRGKAMDKGYNPNSYSRGKKTQQYH